MEVELLISEAGVARVKAVVDSLITKFPSLKQEKAFSRITKCLRKIRVQTEEARLLPEFPRQFSITTQRKKKEVAALPCLRHRLGLKREHLLQQPRK